MAPVFTLTSRNSEREKEQFTGRLRAVPLKGDFCRAEKEKRYKETALSDKKPLNRKLIRHHHLEMGGKIKQSQRRMADWPSGKKKTIAHRLDKKEKPVSSIFRESRKEMASLFCQAK